VNSEVNFEVSDTAHSVLSLGKMITDGAELFVDSTGGYTKKNGGYIDVEIRDNVLMCRAKRLWPETFKQSGPEIRIAPIIHIDAIDDMYNDFDDEAPHSEPGPDMPNEDPDNVANEEIGVPEDPVPRIPIDPSELP
jgi:hypothetical protein